MAALCVLAEELDLIFVLSKKTKSPHNARILLIIDFL